MARNPYFEDDSVTPAMRGRGNSITVGELKAALASIPDDYEVVLDSGEEYSSNAVVEAANANIAYLIPESPLGEAGLLILSAGQIWSAEYDLENRFDAWLESDNPRWTGEEWKAR